MKKLLIATYTLILALAIGLNLRSSIMKELLKPSKPSPRQNGYIIHHKTIESTKEITVLISNEGFGGAMRGTGIMIDSKHVLTCHHMVETAADDLWIYIYPGNRVVKAKPVFGNKELDLAVLELNQVVKRSHYAKFQSKTENGQPITIVGNAAGAMQWFVAYGAISGYFLNRYILTDGLVIGGDSGGPWINEEGEIVAVSDFGFQDRHGNSLGVNGGVAGGQVIDFLAQWRKPAPDFLSIIMGQ